jgi:hypothetical protein
VFGANGSTRKKRKHTRTIIRKRERRYDGFPRSELINGHAVRWSYKEKAYVPLIRR